MDKPSLPFETAKTLLATCAQVDSEIAPWSHGRTKEWVPQNRKPERDAKPEEYAADVLARGTSYGEFYVTVNETAEFAQTRFDGNEARDLTFASNPKARGEIRSDVLGEFIRLPGGGKFRLLGSPMRP